MGKQHGIGNSTSEALGLGQGSVCYFLSPSQPQFTRGSHEAQLQGLPHGVVTYTKCLGPCKQAFVVFMYPVMLVLLSFPTPSHSSCLSQFTDPRSRARRTVLQDWLTTLIQGFQGNNDNVLILQESIFVLGVSVLYREVVSEIVAVSGPRSSSVGETLEGEMGTLLLSLKSGHPGSCLVDLVRGKEGERESYSERPVDCISLQMCGPRLCASTNETGHQAAGSRNA